MEIIKFTFAGLKLQEPMALVTNWLIASFCFYAYFSLFHKKSDELFHWKRFFLVFGISTFFAGLSHLFFQYFDIPGKFPNWITGIIAGYYAGKAMIFQLSNDKSKQILEIGLLVKGSVFLLLALYLQQFIFVMVDAILTYVTFCGVIGFMLYKSGKNEMKYMVFGVLVSLPAVFIFIFKINPHLWFNKDDLSHILMLCCVIFFYIGANKLSFRYVQRN